MLLIICWNFLRWFLLKPRVFCRSSCMWRHGFNCATTPHTAHISAIQDFLRSIFCVTRAHKPEFHGTEFVSLCDWNNGDFFYYRRSSRLVYGLITDQPFFCTRNLFPLHCWNEIRLQFHTIHQHHPALIYATMHPLHFQKSSICFSFIHTPAYVQ